MQSTIPQPASSKSVFRFTEFFSGRTRACGVFEDRFGRLRRRIDVEMLGAWRNNIFVLDESFTYETGETENRTWLIEPLSGNNFRATCPDCVGVAHGVCDADSIRMSYRFLLQMNARDIVVSFDDRIYRMGDQIAVNRATMSKWGVKLGELSLFFHRVADGDFPVKGRANS